MNQRHRVADRKRSDGHVVVIAAGDVNGHDAGAVEQSGPRLGSPDIRAAGASPDFSNVAGSGQALRRRSLMKYTSRRVYLPPVLDLATISAAACNPPATSALRVRQLQIIDLAGHLVAIVGWARNDHLGWRAHQDQAVAVAGIRLVEDRVGLRLGGLESRQVVAAAGSHRERRVDDNDPVRSPL